MWAIAKRPINHQVFVGLGWMWAIRTTTGFCGVGGYFSKYGSVWVVASGLDTQLPIFLWVIPWGRKLNHAHTMVLARASMTRKVRHRASSCRVVVYFSHKNPMIMQRIKNSKSVTTSGTGSSISSLFEKANSSSRPTHSQRTHSQKKFAFSNKA